MQNAEFQFIDSDTKEVLWLLVNVMNRCDPLYCQAHQQEPATDAEWDDILAKAEATLEYLGIAPHPLVTK